MNEALKQFDALLQNAAAGMRLFPPNSRYNGVPVLTHSTPDGRELSYIARRLVPPPERFGTLATHLVVQSDRPDLIAARYLGDPEQYWKLCDANRAHRPDELIETPGRRLRIPLPEAIPG